MNAALIEAVGWAGASSVLIGYALLTAKRIPAGSLFQALNLAGALGLAFHGAARGSWPSAAVNLLWLAIGLGALLHQHRTRARQMAATVSSVRD